MDFNNDDKSVSNVSIINSSAGELTITGEGALHLPAGNTSKRPTFENGLIRYNNQTGYVELSSNSSWINVIDAVDKTGDTMTGSLSLPATKGEGLLLDGEYSWFDIIGDITPKTGGAQAASLQPFIGPVKSWAHTAVSYGDLLYHIPHVYAPNTDMFMHIHWGHNGTNISGSFIVKFWATYAKRSYPATPFVTPVLLTLTEANLNMTNSPRYGHRVDEIPLSIAGGSANLLDTSAIEVDGLVSIHYEIDTIPSITGSDFSNLPYIQTIDLHIQTTNIGTINKDPNFYGV